MWVTVRTSYCNNMDREILRLGRLHYVEMGLANAPKRIQGIQTRIVVSTNGPLRENGINEAPKNVIKINRLNMYI
jgi:hypothetical protein